MIKHVWSVVCLNSVIDSESNRISLIDVLEQITLKPRGKVSLPASIPISVHLVTLWAKSPEGGSSKGTARVFVENPTNKKISPLEYEIDLSKVRRHRQRIRFQGLVVEKPGYYYFVVQFKDAASAQWKEVARVPIEVLLES